MWDRIGWRIISARTKSARTSNELDVDGIERIFRLPKRDWVKAVQQRLAEGPLDPDDLSLAAAGYPELYRVAFYLSQPALQHWRDSGSLRFPAACCVCNRPASLSKPIIRNRKKGSGFAEAGQSAPVCDEHEPLLLISREETSPSAVWFSLTGLNRAFLEKTRELAVAGDVPPPWIAFPGNEPESGFWRQSGEPWLTGVFRPFWKSLNADQRTSYAEKWGAPQDWLDRLLFLLE